MQRCIDIVRTAEDNPDKGRERTRPHMRKHTAKPQRKGPPRNINLRVKPHARSLIDRACAITDKRITDFVLDAACREAEDVLLDRRLFHLDESAYRAFVHALDAPTRRNPELKKLLSRKPLWEN